ncbi:MerR family DNA-binding protein [Herbidospora sp. NEAU-GS84]|uniref:MerR family DNA-binding protein n=1 Tax=Herbidospora solisilvae TaxID=2696284 RepID=A0A7C9NMB8_9ACTN|nr:MerR family DNA-binding protein [Herbidospora solisilvae]
MAVIVRARQAGLSLPDIRALFAAPPDRKAIIKRHQDDLKRRIAEIQATVDFLEGGLRARRFHHLSGLPEEPLSECFMTPPRWASLPNPEHCGLKYFGSLSECFELSEEA